MPLITVFLIVQIVGTRHLADREQSNVLGEISRVVGLESNVFASDIDHRDRSHGVQVVQPDSALPLELLMERRIDTGINDEDLCLTVFDINA
jgi:hypothetical protein